MAVIWLHVSDIHLSISNPHERDVVIPALFDFVKKSREKGEWKPDFIFATGDIAERGSVAAFKAKGQDKALATAFFDGLLEAAALEKDRLFIVPGNHDVEQRMGNGLVRTLTSQDASDIYFDPQSPMYHLSGKLGAFASWYNDYFSTVLPPRTFPEKSTCQLIPYRLTKEDKDFQLKMLLMNSTLFCEDSQTDHGKLWIGLRNLDPLIKQLKEENHDLVVALVHHPFECLANDSELTQIPELLKSVVDILMRGHNHKPVAELRDNLIEIAAGATFLSGEQKDKRALYGRFDGKTVEVFPVCYQKNSSPKKWADDNALFPENEKGTYTKSFPVRSRTNPLSTDPSARPVPDIQPDNYYATIYQESLKAELDHFLPDAIESFSPKVSDVYVSLSLSEKLHTEDRYSPEAEKVDRDKEQSHTPEKVMISLHEKNYRLLLVIGDPGSGKTTLLQHYALSCLDTDRYKEFGFTEPVMVFYFPLRAIKPTGSGYAPLPANIFAWSEEHSLAIPEKFFFLSLRQRKTLVLLDGLDEISELEERKNVCEWIKNAMTSFPKATIVVTSRQTGYRKMDKIRIQAPFMRADILDFDKQQKNSFLQQWFKALFRDKSLGAEATALKKADALFAFLHEEQNRSLRQMAGLPLLLQIMSMLWNKHDKLSPSRSTLYEHALDYLLDYQYEVKKRKPLLAAADAKKVLSSVALLMQEKWKSDKIGREVMKKGVQSALNKIPMEKNPPTAEEFCKDMVERAGLLVEYGKQEYIFRHKSFREYLVAFHLITPVNKSYSLKKLVTHFGEDWWNEPLRYFFGMIDEKSFDDFMHNFFDSVSEDLNEKKQGLLRTIIEETPKANRKIDALCNKLLISSTATRQQVILDCLKTIDNPEALHTLEHFRALQLAKETKEIFSRTEDVIIALGGQALERAPEKSESGKPLSLRNPNEDNAEYILIRGGSYIYSVTEEIVEVPDRYFAKYPVTNKLYRSFIAFLNSRGSKQDFLQAIAKSDKWDDGFSAYLKKGKNDLAALFRSQFDEDRKFGGDDQPVVGVTWYAAQAYGIWLSQLEGKIYRLPTGVEWEWAAGGRQGTTGEKVREYPWPDEKGEASPKLLNFDGNVGETTPVGSYSEGATPEGLYDMAGNVWEWTEEWWDEDTCSNRVLRGGSWNYYAGNCRSAFRNPDTPDSRNSGTGFRLAFVP